MTQPNQAKKKYTKPLVSKSTLMVKFSSTCSESEIKSLIDSINGYGTRIGNLINRYAVDVPFGQEAKIIEQLRTSSIVDSVGEDYIQGGRPSAPPKTRKKYDEYFE